MIFSEFEAWLEGFKEAMAGKAPTKTQWDKIQKKLALVTDTKPYPYHPYHPYPYHWYVATIPYSTTTIDSVPDWKNQIGTWSDTITTVSNEQLTLTSHTF